MNCSPGPSRPARASPSGCRRGFKYSEIQHGAAYFFDEAALAGLIRFVQPVMSEEYRSRAGRQELFEISGHHTPGRIAEPPEQGPFAAIGDHGSRLRDVLKIGTKRPVLDASRRSAKSAVRRRFFSMSK